MATGTGNLDTPMITFDHVSKRYRLGGGPRQVLLDAFGLTKLLGGSVVREDFLALDDVSFDIKPGERVGLVGRNGAGKTTLLKLIAGNYAATAGSIRVNGSVQALMTMGQGFHPDYTGRDNINASLQYNGLSSRELKSAFDDVVDFCELGSFLEQPFKTYSSGMQARLMFATATAIEPEVLIIDEVLGAGDAYFLAKSKLRVERLVNSGCTLLLVSHAMGQVLELCNRAIWLDGGRVRADGEAFPIVKAYEEAMYGALEGTGDPSVSRRSGVIGQVSSDEIGLSPQDAKCREPVRPRIADLAGRRASRALRGADHTPLMQLPTFRPHFEEVGLPQVPESEGRLMRNIARGGISRWASSGGLSVTGFSVSGPDGPTERLVTMQKARFTLFLEAKDAGEYRCTYGMAVHDLQGRGFARCFSPPDRFVAHAGQGRRVEMDLNPLQIGPGRYTVGISVLHETTIENANHAARYDLLSRSFEIDVLFPDSMNAMIADFVHTSEWTFGNANLPAAAEVESIGQNRKSVGSIVDKNLSAGN